MTRHRPHRLRSRPNHERWLVSYADFITLLFAFFVVLYASSQNDQKKAARLGSAIEEAFQRLGMGQSPASSRAIPEIAQIGGANADSAPAQVREEIGHIPRQMSSQEVAALSNELQHSLLPEIERHDIALRNTPDGLVISLLELGFFESGSATLRVESQDAIARIAVVLQERKCHVRVEGHTDPVPIHTPQFDSNWELSAARATGIVKLLVQKHHFDPAEIAAGGYAEFHPVVANDTAEGRRTNRRVDIVIISAVVPANGYATPSTSLSATPLD